VARSALAQGGAPSQNCWSFRFDNGQPEFRLIGFACDGDGFTAPLGAKEDLACFLDGLDVGPRGGARTWLISLPLKARVAGECPRTLLIPL